MADSTGNEEAIVGPIEGEEISLREKIQNLWDRKGIETQVLAEGRTLAQSEEERMKSDLDWAFDQLPVSLFPDVPRGEVIEIQSDMSIAEAVTLLSKNRIWSAPVRKAGVPDDLRWVDRYIGILDYAAIVTWVLNVSETAAAGITAGATAAGSAVGSTLALVGTAALGATGVGIAAGLVAGAAAGAVGVGSAVAAGPGSSGTALVSTLGSDFFQALKDNDLFQKTKVEDIAGSLPWAPFLTVSPEDTIRTLLLLASKFNTRSIPIVQKGFPAIKNYITQSAMLRLLEDCSGFPFFDQIASKSLSDLDLIKPVEESQTVEEDRPILEPFQKMAVHRLGGIAVLASGSDKLVGNISTRDIRFLLVSPEHFHQRESITVKDFMESIRVSRGSLDTSLPAVSPPIVGQASERLCNVIAKMNSCRIHQLYIVDNKGRLESVVSLRDIISKFIRDPPFPRPQSTATDSNNLKTSL